MFFGVATTQGVSLKVVKDFEVKNCISICYYFVVVYCVDKIRNQLKKYSEKNCLTLGFYAMYYIFQTKFVSINN